MASVVSSTTTKSVVFPPPPPTHNTLTLEQRAQLRKSTKKLRQILGATPRLIDTDVVSILAPVHIQLPPRNEAPSPVLSESSFDSYSSRSSSCSIYPVHPYAACASFEHRLSTSSPSPSRQGSLRLKHCSGCASENVDKANARTPALRLAVSPPSPVSPARPSSSSSNSSSFSQTSVSIKESHIRSNYLHDTTTCSSSDMKFTLSPLRHSDESISEPSFIIPFPSRARREKMDRLRKVLGDDVPVHLVFPDQNSDTELSEESEGSFATGYTPSGIVPVAVAGTVIPRPKKANSGKLVGARDSMGSLTPHHAKRQEKQKTEKPLSSTPPSPPTIVIPASSIPKDTSQKKLCVIVESPDEHGLSSFEGFGFGSSMFTKKPSATVIQSSWHVRDGLAIHDVGKEDTNKVWSTRKGYAGWDRSMVVGKLEQERKRVMSYRKPPPPMYF